MDRTLPWRRAVRGAGVLLALVFVSAGTACTTPTKGEIVVPHSPDGSIEAGHVVWWQLNPDPAASGPNNLDWDVLDIQVVDDRCIVAVGTGGKFFRSTNFGDSWIVSQTLPGTMHAVYFHDCQTGYAAGKPHAILRTQDGGVTWENTLEFPTNPVHAPGGEWHINDLHFLDETNGVAVGKGPGPTGLIFWTDDGAETWAWNYSGTSTLKAIDFADDELGLAVGGELFSGSGAAVVRTTSGASGDASVPSYSTPTSAGWDRLGSNVAAGLGAGAGAFTGIAFLDETTAYAVGTSAGHGAGIFATPDAGDTWTTTGFNECLGSAWGGFLDVAYPTPTEGTIVGSNGVILRNSGGPDDWDFQVSRTLVTLTSVDFLDADRGAAGGRGNTILTTDDGGDTWSGPRSVTMRDLVAIDHLGDGFIAAAGDRGTIVVSDDGGDSWQTQFSCGRGWLLNDIAFSTRTTGIAVGLHGYVVHTTDGQTWQEPEDYPFTTAPHDPRMDMNGIDFFTHSTAVAVGNERVAITDDGGRTWQARDLPPGTCLTDVVTLDERRAVAVGRRGVVLLTDDAGQTWQPVTTPVTDHLSGVFFLDEQRGWAVGYGPGFRNSVENTNPATADRGIILHTDDGGSTWTEQPSGTQRALWAVAFADPLNGLAVGGHGGTWYQLGSGPQVEGEILVTNDGGSTWREASLPKQRNLSDVEITPGGSIYVAGTTGLVLRTDDISALTGGS